MKHDLSACILVPSSDCVSSQLRVSVLFIAVPTSVENGLQLLTQ